MKLSFFSLGSGSSGNCYLIGNEHYNILVDAGISSTSISRFMKKMNIPMETIMGVLITHNHIDHIRGLDVLTRRYSLPVFTTHNIRKSILTPHWRNPHDCIHEIPMLQKFRLAGFDIEAFPVSHDAPETVGFHIRSDNNRITIATDLGYICQTSARYIKEANILVLESNYDEQMLDNGSYPLFLKRRIKSDHGHLGNSQASGFLAEIFNDNLRYVCLAHLSKNNNTPEKALMTLHQSFSDKGITLSDYQKIMVLNRTAPTEIINLDN